MVAKAVGKVAVWIRLLVVTDISCQHTFAIQMVTGTVHANGVAHAIGASVSEFLARQYNNTLGI